MTTSNRHPDQEARERALDTSGSFAVQSPAGSGKTELLMQRFLALLSLVDRPEEVLALTFTRKAAGEMHNRILGAMRKAAQGHVPEAGHEKRTVELAGRALERDREMGWSLLENPWRLKVVTIDSFCSSVVRQMPMLSGLSRYAITDEPQEFYREAAERTVALVEEDGVRGDAARRALSHLDNSVKGLVDRLVLMLEKRDQWLRHIGRAMTPEELRALLEGSLARLINYELEAISRVFTPGVCSSLLPFARYAARNSPAGSVIAGLGGFDGQVPCDASALPLWRAIRELLLTKEGTIRSRVDKNIGFPAGAGEAAEMKEGFNVFLAALAGVDGFADALHRVAVLPEAGFLDPEWAALEAITALLPIADGMLAEAFAASGAVDFQAVSLAALKALGTEDEPTDLMLALDLRIKHILVDEYQDTSHTQLRLIEALTRGWTEGDGRTLFVVGDPMQSIYLFREAEVGLFLEARHGRVGTVRMEPLTLSRNFRSEAGIVDWVNRSVSRAFPEAEDIFTGAVTYSPSVAARGSSGAVAITVFEGRDDVAEANRVVSILRSIPEGESTAIICRSKGNLDSIVEAIKRAGIRFGAQNIDPLADRVAVRDLTALLRALTHPLDRVAWLACLRAPWCALPLSDMHALFSLDATAPVRAILDDPVRLAAMSGDGRRRVSRFAAWMDKALDDWGRRAPSEVLRGLWTALGGPACLEGEPDREDAMRFFSLVESVESSGAVSMDELEARMERLCADHSGGPGTALSVMTIHKAKGLEFDNVIIPGMGRRARGDDKGLLVWMERGEDDLLLAPVERKNGGGDSRIYAYLTAIKKEKLYYEEARLLYVAATRAKKALYMLGHAATGADGSIEPDAKSLLWRIREAIEPGMLSGPGGPAGPREKRARGITRLPAGWELPAPVEPLASGGAPGAPGEGPVFYWAGQEVKHLGTAVHRYFCRISKEGLARWDARRIRGEEPRVRAMLKALGLGGRDAARAAAEGVEILLKATEDERGRWALSDHHEAQSEMPLTAVVKGEITRVVMDRTFVEDGVRWVIDFKTGFHAGGALDEFLDGERERYRGQLMKYEAALRAFGEKRPIRKGLYYPAHRAWVEL